MMTLKEFRQRTRRLPGDTPIQVEYIKDHSHEWFYPNEIKVGPDILPGRKDVCIVVHDHPDFGI